MQVYSEAYSEDEKRNSPSFDHAFVESIEDSVIFRSSFCTVYRIERSLGVRVVCNRDLWLTRIVGLVVIFYPKSQRKTAFSNGDFKDLHI